jgi:hypothetical protein
MRSTTIPGGAIPCPLGFLACLKGDTIMKCDIVVIGTARPVVNHRPSIPPDVPLLRYSRHFRFVDRYLRCVGVRNIRYKLRSL